MYLITKFDKLLKVPLTANFSSSESLSSNNLVTFLDISTGSDGTITTRRIYILLANGTYLVPTGTTTDYIVWDYANASIVVDILTQSTAASVRVDWLAGSSVVYTKTILMGWDLYDYVFLFGLLQTQTSKPNIIDDSNYYNNTLAMIVNLFQGENAIEKMDDLYSSQAAFNRNTFLINNQNLFF